MSMDSYSKRKALKLWSELQHDPGSYVEEHPMEAVKARDWRFARWVSESIGTTGKTNGATVVYYTQRPWRDFYRDLVKYEVASRPWDTVWSNDE